MNFLSHSFRVGRLFGIDIRVHILFLIWIAFRLFDATRGGYDWKEELLFLGLLFGIVLLHEFGHCFGARSVGGDAENIMMWPLGGLAYAHAPMRPWPQFVTVAAGPAVNVAFCILSAAAIFILSGASILPGVNPLRTGLHLVRDVPAFTPMLGETSFIALFTFYRVNLFLLAFNLLPIYPLDGGQLFHAIIWPFVGLQRASIIACQVGLVGCALFGLWGLSTQGAGMLVFIAIFGGFTCWQRLQAARYGLLVEDQAFTPYTHRPSGGSGRGFWSRLLKTKPRRRTVVHPMEYPNPNPGGWQAKQQEREQEHEELDRILKKVHERGVGSLSYVERQTLERITRARQEEERDFQHGNRV